MHITPKTLVSNMSWACTTEVSSAAPIEPAPALLTRTSPSVLLQHLLDRVGDRGVAGHIEVEERHVADNQETDVSAETDERVPVTAA